MRDETGAPYSGTLSWRTDIGSSVHNVSGSVTVSQGWGRFGYTGTTVGQDVVVMGTTSTNNLTPAPATRVWYAVGADRSSTTPARIVFDDPYYDWPVDGSYRYHGFAVYNAAGERITATNDTEWSAVLSGVHGPRTFSGTLDSTGYGKFAYYVETAGWDELVVTIGAVAGSAARSYGLTYIEPGDPTPTPTPEPTLEPIPTPTPDPVPTLDAPPDPCELAGDCQLPPTEDLPSDCSLPVSPIDEDISEPVDDVVGGPLPLGQEHYYGMGNDTSPQDGVVDGLKAHGINDFPTASHWDHDQYSGLQAVQIFSFAKVHRACGARGGDVGIHKTHDASNGDVFAAETRVRIVDENDPELINFYMRLTFHPMRENQSIIKGSECNNILVQETADDRWYNISRTCQMPASEVGNVRINVRAHARPKNAPNNLEVAGSGTVQIDWLKFSKVACTSGPSC